MTLGLALEGRVMLVTSTLGLWFLPGVIGSGHTCDFNIGTGVRG